LQGNTQNDPVMFFNYCHKPSAFSCKRILIIVTITFTLTLFFTYIKFFRRLPVQEILNLNRRHNSNYTYKSPTYDYYDDSISRDYDTDYSIRTSESSKHLWNEFIKRNNYVSVGDIYQTPCDETVNKIQIGKTILMVDRSGVLSTKTFLNVSVTSEITQGEFFLEVKYEGKKIYSAHFPLCNEDNTPDSIKLPCPISIGIHKYMRKADVPGFLPKGTYYTKVWATDQTERVLGCGYCEFTI